MATQNNDGFYNETQNNENEYKEPVLQTVLMEDLPNGRFYNDGGFGFGEDPQKKERAREIKRLSNASTLPLIMFWVLGEVFVFALVIILQLCIGTKSTDLIVRDIDFNYIFNGFLSVTLLSLPFLLTAKITGQPLSKTTNIKKCKSGRALPCIMLGFGVCMIANYLNNVFANFFTSVSGEQVVEPSIGYGQGIKSLVIYLICVGVIPAVMEEFAFRGVLLGTARKYTSDGFAIISNAILFSLLHGNLRQIPFTFLLGIYLAYITVYTDSVVPAMVVHCVNNAMSVILSMSTAGLSPLTQTVVYGLYFLAMLLVGLCGLVLLLHRDKGALRLSSERSDDTLFVARNFFTSIGFLVFAAFAVVRIVQIQWL